MIEKCELCRCCGSEIFEIFKGEIFDKTITYFECKVCDYVQTECPYWLEQAYQNPINKSDTGILARNYSNLEVVISTLFLLGEIKGKVVDVAGGYGILVRLLRDYGINALWSDPYCENLLAKGFEYKIGKVNLVTSFESFEHFINPADELNRILKISNNLLISTEIIPFPTPKQEDWWYYGSDHGQHIGFFRVNTLKKLANINQKNFVSDGKKYHLFTNCNINPIVWKTTLRLKKLLPPLAKHALGSKTFSDALNLNIK